MMAAPKGLPSKKWRIIGPDRCQYPTPLYLAASNCKRKLRESRSRRRRATASQPKSTAYVVHWPCRIQTKRTHCCPGCQGPMRPGFSPSYGLLEVRSYRCIVCEEVVTLEHERSAHSGRPQPDRNHPRLLRQRFHGRRGQPLVRAADRVFRHSALHRDPDQPAKDA